MAYTAPTAIAGYDGSVTGPTGTSEVRSWRLDVTTEPLDATSFNSAGFKDYISGLQGATGSLTCAGTAIPTRGASACTLKTKSSGGATITGSILLHKVGVGVPVDGQVTYDCDFNFTGSFSVG